MKFKRIARKAGSLVTMGTAVLGSLTICSCGYRPMCGSVDYVLVEAGGTITEDRQLIAERIPRARVSIAWANNLEDIADPVTFVEENGRSIGPSSADGSFRFRVCGVDTAHPFAAVPSITFRPRVAFIGVQRPSDADVEVLVLEFLDGSEQLAANQLKVFSGHTIEIAVQDFDFGVLYPATFEVIGE